MGKIKIGKIRITFVFRHKWDAKNKIRHSSEFNYYRIGLWYKKSKIVGNIDFNRPKNWGNKLVNDYMIGIDLIICKMWVSFSRDGLFFEIK